jgi:hypothetical protein
MAPHSSAFGYRRQMLGVLLATAVAVALAGPGAARADKLPDALSICAVWVLCYGMMRAFVWLAARPLMRRWPRMVHNWGLFWFYGAIPLFLSALYLGSWASGAPTPSPTTVAFVVAAATSVAAGAFAAIRATPVRPAVAS